MSDQLTRLLSIISRLRDPDTGCDWDKAQNFKSIAPYTVEEAYEVVDTIERGAMDELRGELGDLLLQVVFHAQMAAEASLFDFNDVAGTIADKMERRHPHVFGTDTGQMTETRWEELKASERLAEGEKSAMDGVAMALPALMRAEKLQKRAARDGFDWPDVDGPAAKVFEEAQELTEAAPDKRQEEAGDLLFAAVNLVRAYGIAPETALRSANAKFERRYRAMETKAQESFKSLSLDQKENLWKQVKADESS